MSNSILKRVFAVAAGLVGALSALTTMGSETANPSATTSNPEAWYAGVPAFTSLERLPYLRRGVQTHQFCSYDRAGDNYDADYFPICVDASGEGLFFDAYGPGCLYRLQMNIWNGDVGGINIRFYFDDEPKARIDMDVTQFFSTNNPLGIFQAPLAHVGKGYRLLYHPFFFARRLKVTLSKEPIGPAPGWDKLPWQGHYKEHPARRNHWYQFTYHTYTESPGLSSWTQPPDMAPVIAMWNPTNMAAPPQLATVAVTDNVELALAAGADAKALRLKRAGTITALHLSLAPEDEAALFDTWLTISFDGSTKPQVEAPSAACSAPIAPRRRNASPRASSARKARICNATCPCRSGNQRPSASQTAAHVG